MDLEQLLQRFGVTTSKELYLAFQAEDQRTFVDRQWDYNNPDLLINKIKQAVDMVANQDLHEDDTYWLREIRWLWHHHAISCACARYQSREMAQYHSGMALKYLDQLLGNKITKLLYLLVRGRVVEAELWAEGIECEVESETARACLDDYKKGLFFKSPQTH